MGMKGIRTTCESFVLKKDKNTMSKVNGPNQGSPINRPEAGIVNQAAQLQKAQKVTAGALGNLSSSTNVIQAIVEQAVKA